VPGTSQESVRRTEGSLESARGERLLHRSWEPAVAAGRAVLLVHGFGEHSGRYDEIASWLAARGFAVHAYDQLGHGRSPGERGFVPSFSAFPDDLELAFSKLCDAHPGIPCGVVGHSMGGLVTACWLARTESQPSWAVLSGPALSVSMSSARLALARIMGRLLPRVSLDAGLPTTALSRDPEVLRRYDEDPLVHGRVCAALGVGMHDAGVWVSGQAERIRTPVLLLHGAEDLLCDPAASERFHRALQGLGGPDAHGLKIYPGLKHEIFNEPEREDVYRDLLGWVEGTEKRRALE